MSTNSKTIQGSSLTNKINLKRYTLINTNKKQVIDREEIISNYSQETIDQVWSSLSINIIQNYQRGKGTLIKGFGVFTYKPTEVVLEGVTNQYERDLRFREPIFIVSKELNEKFLPGEYNRQNGIRYYTQKESKDISIVKVNYAEMAYSISISKDELTNLLKHLFMYIGESIVNKTFKNKIFPGLGILINKNNLIAVKFDENFINNIKSKTQTLLFTKKNIFLDLDMDNAQETTSYKCLTPYKNIEHLKSTNALTTKCEKSGRNYMLNKYRINVRKYPEQILKKISSTPKSTNNMNMKNISFRFLNDIDNPSISTNTNINTNNIDNAYNNLSFLDDETLKSIEYFKGIMIKNCKSYDTSGNGLISKSETIDALIKTNINNKIDYNTAKLMVNALNKTENVEYMKFIAQLVKYSKLALLKKNKKNSKTLMIDTIKINPNDINYNSFKRENFFNSNSKNFATMTYTNGFFPKNSQKREKFFKKNAIIYPHQKTKNNICFNKTTNNFFKRPSNLSYNNELKEEEEKNRYNSANSVNNTKCIKSSAPMSKNNKKIKTINFYKIQNETEKIKTYLAPIINLMPTLKQKYFISLDQKISSEEFMNILNTYHILYPKNKIEEVLQFLGIPDINAFSLREFEQYIKACKIIESTIGLTELNNIMKKLKDIIYINGGINFLFNNEINPKDKINCETFVKILQDKVPYSSETLTNVFIYLVKTDREFDMNDYINYFDNPETRITFDEVYYLNMMKKIIKTISDKQFKVDEYFEHLILNNVSTMDKVITRLNWIKYLQKEKLGFSAEELDKLFYWIDTKKDGVIDREEFVNKFNHTLKNLTMIQDIIYTNKLDIEDLAHQMKIDINNANLENYDFETFKKKIKLLNYTYPDEFIKKLFREILATNKNNTNTINNNTEIPTVNAKHFLDEINYVKPPEDYKSFIQNYMDIVRQRTTHKELKAVFESYDKDCLGTLTRINYVEAISGFLQEYNDVDHMRFVRITDMFDKYGNIIYPEVLNLIFFYNKERLSDPFSKLCLLLSNILKHECNNDIECLMYLISKGNTKKLTSLTIHKPLTIEQIKTFLEKINNPIPNKIIQKLDIDADGVISFSDLQSVLKRFIYTSFFKYTNDSTNADINLFSRETMTETKYKHIIKKLNSYKKLKNITDIGLFKKFDVDDDGFISCVDFNKGIDDILVMSPSLKDQFFNYLDFYHNGLVDCETFMKRMKDFKSGDILVQNNNKIEIKILEQLREFIIKNNKMSDNEIFEVIDKDCDGLISIDDLKSFIINDLFISEIEFNKAKLERVMMTLSLSKNTQIGLNDIREFINLCNKNKDFMNLKEVFHITVNQNLSNLKQNKEWTSDIIERLGMFVSEKYDSIEQFFNENSEKGSNKFTFNDFLKFHEKNCELFNNGFNLTKDELLSIYTSLDSHKKKYLTLQDLKNKLQIFNFYNKMHIDVKNFIQENFANGVDAFKFFIKSRNEIEKNDNENIDIYKSYITLKEYFDAFDNFFPNKYPTNTILKYLNKYFGITLSNNNNKNNLLNKKETINFSEFNYLYFDKFKYNEDFLYEKNKDTKLMTNRNDISKRIKNNFLQKSQNNFYYSNLFKKKFEKLSTPFDKDPLLKIKRILCSSKYNLNKFFEAAALECGNDKFIVNKYQFRNIIKNLDIGLTNLEIDQIMFQSGKLTYDNLLNLRDFIRFLYNQNYTIEEGKNNTIPIISEIKSLIYKYYSNPIICFQNNDTDRSGKIDFNKFKNIIFDMYNKNEIKIPNFTLIKNAFDTIDLRKDGIIDLNEWCKAFSSFNGTLDVEAEKVANGFEFFDKKFNTKNNFKNINKIDHNRKILREWETSGDVTVLYKYFYKNRKFIKEKIKENNFFIGTHGTELVHSGNLISILKDMLPNLRISQTQWKMIVNIAQAERVDELIDINEFFRLLEITSRNVISHPLINKKSIKNK